MTGRVIFISGASSGIGAACARVFSSSGAKVIMTARRKSRLDEIADTLDGPSLAVELDITDHESVESVVSGLPEEFAEIDVLINNAGLGRGLEKLHEGNVGGWEEMIDTNIKGLLYLSRTIIPRMVKRGSGHVINIGSIAGHQVYPGGNVYCATKHAVDALTQGMRLDLYDQPIRVSTIDPGLVETEFSHVRFYGDEERARTVYEGYTPLTGQDIAESALWIASRPPHVQVAEMIIFPTDQASAAVTFKRK